MHPSLLPVFLFTTLAPLFVVAQDGPRAAHEVGEALRELPPTWPLVVDRPTADSVFCVRGEGYKARFHAAGWSFGARPDDVRYATEPIEFHLAAATVGGLQLPVPDVDPEQADHRIDYVRGDLRESIEVRQREVEQTFTFSALPTCGAITLQVQANSTLQGIDAGAAGVRFQGEHATVTYGEAVAIDAVGNRCVAPTHWRAGVITIEVPEAFVRAATLPLVVDPVVRSVVVNAGWPPTTEHDITWFESIQQYAVVYEMLFAQGDNDCSVEFLTADLVPAGFGVIDIDHPNWTKPRIAYLASDTQVLVVAEVNDHNLPAPTWIRARTVGPTHITGRQFDVEKAGLPGHLPGDKHNPDICGNPNPLGPTYYTVVWETVVSASNRDIHMKQVAHDTHLVPVTPVVLSSSLAFDGNPSISPSHGPTPVALQHAVVVWEHRLLPVLDSNIHACALHWDGSFLVTELELDGSGHDDGLPQVSTASIGNGNVQPGQGRRQVMVTYDRRRNGSADVMGRVFDFLQVSGPFLATNLTLLDTPVAEQPWLQRAAHVESDGERFTVAFHQAHGVTGDLSVRVSTFAGDPITSALTLLGTDVVGASGSHEWAPHLTSRYSGSGVASRRHGLAWFRSNPGASLWVSTYDNGVVDGGFNTRYLGCGVLGLQAQGEARLGGSFGVQLTGASGLPGLLIGLPTSLPVPPCGNCRVGVDGWVQGGTQVQVALPLWPSLVGVTLSFQGFTFDTAGPCLSAISLSPTVDARLYW